MHADDILMLATSRAIAIQKLKCLIYYCKENYIKLQLSKCAMMCINGNLHDQEPLCVEDTILKSVESECYLGSVITNSCNLNKDVEADIKQRQVSIVKFFAFLRTNINAPVQVKLKVLEACVVSALLHNAETWADSNIERLEVSHRKMLKAIMGVRSTTCSELLYVELEVISIKTYVMIKQWKFWKKVAELSDDETKI